MKVIDLINDLFDYREFQPDKLPKKVRFNNIEFIYKDRSYYTEKDENIMKYITHTLDLRVEVEIIEDEFIDIEEIGADETSNLDLAETFDFLEEKINQLIKNQKKIIERLKDGK